MDEANLKKQPIAYGPASVFFTKIIDTHSSIRQAIVFKW